MYTTHVLLFDGNKPGQAQKCSHTVQFLFDSCWNLSGSVCEFVSEHADTPYSYQIHKCVHTQAWQYTCTHTYCIWINLHDMHTQTHTYTHACTTSSLCCLRCWDLTDIVLSIILCCPFTSDVLSLWHFLWTIHYLGNHALFKIFIKMISVELAAEQ